MGLKHDGRLLLGIDEIHSRSCISEILKEDAVSFIHSFILETYSASSRDYYSEALPAQPRTKKKDLERCKIWKGGPSARNAAQSGDHSMLMDPQPKRPFAA